MMHVWVCGCGSIMCLYLRVHACAYVYVFIWCVYVYKIVCLCACIYRVHITWACMRVCVRVILPPARGSPPSVVAVWGVGSGQGRPCLGLLAISFFLLFSCVLMVVALRAAAGDKPLFVTERRNEMGKIPSLSPSLSCQGSKWGFLCGLCQAALDIKALAGRVGQLVGCNGSPRKPAGSGGGSQSRGARLGGCQRPPEPQPTAHSPLVPSCGRAPHGGSALPRLV